MFGFLVKKAFFDMWDNLFAIVALNLGFIASFAIVIFLPSLFLETPATFYVASFISLLILFVYAGTASAYCRDIADYKTPQFRDFVEHLKGSFLTSLVFALVNSLYAFLLSVALPTYLNFKSFMGIIAFSFLFWVTVLWIVASEYFYPVQARFGRKFIETIKKMLLIFFDNTGFSLGLFLGCLITLVISSFTAFLLPGFATILLWVNVALKLRLYKYDYLEEHPDADRKKIPWDALLLDDRDRVGKRTLRGFIFPWKE